MPSFRTSAVALVASLLTSACVVGPNFKPPAPPAVSSYSAEPARTTAATPGVVGGDAQHFLSGAEIPDEDFARLYFQVDDFSSRTRIRSASAAHMPRKCPPD